MRYTLEMDIDLPRERMVALFDDPENLKHWQPGLESFEPLDGEPGEVGSTSRLTYRLGHREVQMTETIVERDMPDSFVATYETDGVWNEVRNTFVEAGPSTTHWVLDTDFRFKGLLMRFMALLIPWAFKKQSQRHMEQFKEFAEGQASDG